MRNLLFIPLCLLSATVAAQNITVWNIGTQDNSAAELALGPADYKQFLSRDFGYEDGFYLVGRSTAKENFPYVLPGPDDTWGGTWNTSGWRTHQTNILFDVETIPTDAKFCLVVDMLDCSPGRSLFKVLINGRQSARFELKGSNNGSIEGKTEGIRSRPLTVEIEPGVLRAGGNEITLTVLEGSWFVFDDVRLESDTEVALRAPDKIFLREVAAADYEIAPGGKRFQPLVVDMETLAPTPAAIEVRLDGRKIFSAVAESGRYQYEAPMPAVKKERTSRYEIFVDGTSVASGQVVRRAARLQTPADYVDTKLGAAHSRWMIAPGPWMPMSMVKLSPDNQNRGWQAGYQPTFETVGTFSHIHEWTMGGLGLMPTNGALQTRVGDQFRPDEGYRSRIDKLTEEAPLGYYKVHMTDTDIVAEVTATTRCGFQRYTFPTDRDGRVMIDLHVEAEYDYLLREVEVTRVGDRRIEGRSHQISPRPHVWSNDADQEYTIHFVIEFDRPIKRIGGWIDGRQTDTSSIEAANVKEAGMWVEFDTRESPVVQVRSGISLVSLAGAAQNLEQEISQPFGWSYDAVVENQKRAWNDILQRVDITTDNRLEKMRFYTNMYRSMCRNTWSDVNGEWMSAGGKVQKFTNPDHVALGCDAFWNSFWNLNQFWNLVTPEWSSRWVQSQLAMYDADGWLAKGPAGMKYIPVMVAEHEIPLIVGAWQMGIRDFDADKALRAMVKMQTTPAGPVATGFAGNRDLVSYMTYRYVPSDMGRFSNTLEYSFDDWTVGQFAKALGKTAEQKIFSERGTWWRNAINPANGYAHLRESNGKFTEDFDPFRSGANQQYVEGNSWQLSYFVPQDVPGLIEIMGEKAFVERLDWGFTASEPWRYNAPNDQYWDYPVVQGNQQSMHFAFLFNWARHPWLTQKWSRSIIDKYYGYGVANAYLGDEDQGQMSAWLVMAAMGLFQTDGGTSATPIYEIASPLYEKVVIDLGGRYGRGRKFTIEARGVSKANKYVQSAVLNGRPLESFWFAASELLGGGSLVLEMGPEPNTGWGVK
jgi:predicted alpha-1,2-mannosidase